MNKALIDRAVAAAQQIRRGIEPSAEQKSALRCALTSRVTVITGGPGTGKTTLLRSLLVALADVGLKPTLAAPTGRAARRLQEASGRDAKTIHRLLEYAPESGGFMRGKNFPLRTNYLIIDEASMMDVELASSLLSALMPNCSLLLVGDRDQLPSVGPGSVLKDVIASDFVPVVQLKEVYRQARKSLIVANAHRLNRGESPATLQRRRRRLLFLRAQRRRRCACDDQAARAAAAGRPLRNHRPARNPGADADESRPARHACAQSRAAGLCSIRRDENSAPATAAFREGDRVIQLRNNYDKLVFNGSIGRIVAIDTDKARVSVVFEETHAEYDLSDLDELALAYAISVHKSQGSQYPAIVMPIHQSHYLMLRRNLIYTAITRAERVCVLVGTRLRCSRRCAIEDERRVSAASPTACVSHSPFALRAASESKRNSSLRRDTRSRARTASQARPMG